MKVAKNMDSVFANCTSDELDFDLMFDEDDSLIDAVCGVNEAGIPWTGPDPETEYQVDGDASYSEKDANRVMHQLVSLLHEMDENVECIIT